MMRAPAIAQSTSFSVRMEAQAMEVVQPRQRKRASAIRPSATRAESLRMSPHTGLLTLDGGGGAGKLAGVSRVAEVIENGFAEHS